MLIRVDIKIREDQKDFLKSLPMNTSEYLRQLIDEDIEKRSRADATTSPSKKGGLNGQSTEYQPSSTQSR